MAPDRSRPKYASRIATALVFLCLALPSSAGAHPPYEYPERVVTDKEGRTLHLVKSYIDGIFLTDPVKLVIRDADDRTVAETEYGRDLSVLCWRSRPCLVFRYDGLTPVLPTNVWRIEDGRLQEARSPALIALGVVAPLWDHAGGYALSIVSLAVPLPVLWLLVRSPGSRRRTLLLTITGLASIPYAGIWLYTVTLLSYVSLPLVILVGAIAGLSVFLARTALLKAGVAESALGAAARVAAWIIVVAAGLSITLLVALFVRVASYSSSITFEEPKVHAPLAKASITRVKGVTNEVFATLGSGVKLEDVVNLDLFSGFDPAMTREEAEGRIGPPSGRWNDPAYKLPAGFYDRPDGRVSLVRQGASEWSTIGHPSGCTHDYVFRDSRLREQLLHWLPPKGVVQVNVLRSVGWGGLTVFLTRDACTHLVLTARDGDPEPR